MIKNISYIIYKFLKFIDNIFFLIFKKSFLSWFPHFQDEDSYKTVNILNKNIKIFTPNNLIEWRVKTILSKEPETIEWINNLII